MPLPERPQLHSHVYWLRDPDDNGSVILGHPLRRGDVRIRLSTAEFHCLPLFDGTRTLREVQVEAVRQAGGKLIPYGLFLTLVERLEHHLFLDGPRVRAILDGPVREPACIGSYPGDADELRDLLGELFSRGPGLPRESRLNGRLRAALLPHIDYLRGGLTYAWGFKELFEQTDASLFVIIGTSHFSTHRFTLTRKHFQTPLGIAPTDQDYVDRLVRHYGDSLFDDELQAHLPEHSIELEVVFLQYLYGDRPFRIVPLVVGSFHDSVQLSSTPRERPDIARMVAALRAVEAETKEPICYLISGDLAHIGPYFSDPEPVSDRALEHSRRRDEVLCDHLKRADHATYFEAIAGENDARRICGLPPTYTVLEALRPGSGKLLHYDQYVAPDRSQSVSFASMAFYR